MAWTSATEQNSRNNNSSEKKKQDPAQFWMNVGYWSKDPETGEDVFISLPMGIAVDQMKPKNVPNSDSSYRQMVEAKNALLEEIQKFMSGFEPGQEETISTLEIQLRRVDEANSETSTAENNPHLSNLSRLGFGKAA